MSNEPCFVGIDGAKAQLDIALRPSGERWAVPNDAGGVVTLVERLQPLHPTLIVLEATGGLERVATAALATAGLPVVVVNPRGGGCQGQRPSDSLPAAAIRYIPRRTRRRKP